jgi:hypothetical protein
MSGHRREKLSMVFKLDCERDAEEIQIGENRLGRSVVAGGINDIQALQMIVRIMQQFGMAMEFNDQGKKITVDSYLKQVEQQGKWSRAIEAGRLSFRFGRVPELKHSFISIEEVNAGSAVSWVDWVNPFLVDDSFVQAWVSDVEYDYWQNAKDPLEYEAAGRSYTHLPTKSNGLAPPLEQIEIDTSNNPGRWSLQSGYVEAVGSVMWLGKSFWQSVGENRKDALLSASWLDAQPIANGVIQVIASEHCFCDKATEVTQDNLRAILYG